MIVILAIFSLLGGFAVGWCFHWLWEQSQKSKPRRGLPPPYEPWHKQFLCLKAYDQERQVISGLWMCGTQTRFALCEGFTKIRNYPMDRFRRDESGFTCKHFGARGECLLVGREATLDEVIW